VRVGVHVSAAQGLVKAAEHAIELGCECVQIFGRNARGWRGREYSEAEVERFRELTARHGLDPIVIHSCYLVNLASPDRELRCRSHDSVADDMVRAAILGARFVVLHFGHHMGRGTAAGLRRVAGRVRSLLARAPAGVELLLENGAGRGTELGADWEHFAILLDLLDGDQRVGMCFDTCHAHAAGHRLDGQRWIGLTLEGLASAMGLERLRLIHLNDSRGEVGSRLDLHEHIGRGTIGSAGIRTFLRRRALRSRAAILETPIEREGDDRRNLRRTKRLRGRTGRRG
jgi:deoxyribonuclease-4